MFADVVDCFLTEPMYRLWSGRVSLYLTYYYRFKVNAGKPVSEWTKLSVDNHTNPGVRRLVSRAYARAGVLPSSNPIPQPHVQLIVFQAILGQAIYDA